MVVPILASTLLSLAASAAPLSSRAAPSTETSDSVIFIVKQTKAGECVPDVNNYAVAATHIGAGMNANVVVPYNASEPGSRYFTNGTIEQVDSSTSNLAFPGGSQAYFYGWEMYATDYNATKDLVQSNIGVGTSGVAIFGGNDEDQAIKFPQLMYTNYTGTLGGSQFYVCKTFVYTADQLQLYWRPDGVTTDPECAEVTLIPQCAGAWTDDTSKPYLQPSPCLADAVSFEP